MNLRADGTGSYHPLQTNYYWLPGIGLWKRRLSSMIVDGPHDNIATLSADASNSTFIAQALPLGKNSRVATLKDGPDD